MAQVDVNAAVEQAIERQALRPGGLLPLLHDIQDRLGYVPEDRIAQIAKAMHLSAAEVYGVVRFYHHFRSQAPGRHVLRLCLAEACRSMGAQQLLEHARAALGIGLHETTGDGEVTLEPVYCLGNCACAPALMVDDAQLVGRVDAERFDAVVSQCRRPS